MKKENTMTAEAVAGRAVTVYALRRELLATGSCEFSDPNEPDCLQAEEEEPCKPCKERHKLRTALQVASRRLRSGILAYVREMTPGGDPATVETVLKGFVERAMTAPEKNENCNYRKLYTYR